MHTASTTQSSDFTPDIIPLALKKHKVYFSKSVAAKLVGGRARLLKLISLGKIAVEKPTVKQNGKWYCSAGDVIRYISLCPPPAATSGRKGIK